MAAISYVGVLMGISVATPATQDAAGFGALALRSRKASGA